MAAVVEVWESNTVAETPTQATALSFGSVDQPNIVAADHPLVIPVAGNIFAYQKYLRWKVTSWGDETTTTIDTLRWFKSAGSLAANWTEWNAAAPGGAYGTPARSSLAETTWPATAPDAIAITGSFANPATGYSTNYAVLNVSINASTVAGNKGSHTVVFAYNES
jgi:hypothetical protein